MEWREHFEAGALEKAKQFDPDLDVEALAKSLVPRIESGEIRNPTAVFVTAARGAKTRGTYRTKRSGEVRVISPKMEELARARIGWYASAARGATPLQIGEAVRRAATRFPGLGLEQEALALIVEAVGWPVARPRVEAEPEEDVPG